MSNEQAVEKEIQDKGKTAPRVTPEMIDASIDSVLFLHQKPSECVGHVNDIAIAQAAMACLTICVLVLKNGFTVVGKSACASPENFDAELGRKIAQADARQQIWALEGYLLKARLANEPVVAQAKAGFCSLCGEPMPPGEEVFSYHGYSGPCPTKPEITTAELPPGPG